MQMSQYFWLFNEDYLTPDNHDDKKCHGNLYTYICICKKYIYKVIGINNNNCMKKKKKNINGMNK